MDKKPTPNRLSYNAGFLAGIAGTPLEVPPEHEKRPGTYAAGHEDGVAANLHRRNGQMAMEQGWHLLRVRANRMLMEQQTIDTVSQ